VEAAVQTCQISSINGDERDKQLSDGIIFTWQTAEPDQQQSVAMLLVTVRAYDTPINTRVQADMSHPAPNSPIS